MWAMLPPPRVATLPLEEEAPLVGGSSDGSELDVVFLAAVNFQTLGVAGVVLIGLDTAGLVAAVGGLEVVAV